LSRFLDLEKDRYVEYKATATDIPEAAREAGKYKGKARPFCLPEALAEYNLLDEIRDDARLYFDEMKIKWHDGRNGNPSNHLCDSQVCCVNFLYPFADRASALAELLRPLFPSIQQMIKIQPDNRFVVHEWIGAENYLGEKISRNGKRTRGANFTSADAGVMFVRQDGTRQFVLIEWKYTETYGPVDLKFSKSGTDRTEIYRPLFEADDFPVDKDLLPSFGSLFFEPFYQLMRQQCLANEMERAGELGADIVSLLHIAPDHNPGFQRVTSPDLLELGDTVTGVWKRLVTEPDRFQSISVEQLFGQFPVDRHPEMRSWWKYISHRYPWFLEREGVA